MNSKSQYLKWRKNHFCRKLLFRSAIIGWIIKTTPSTIIPFFSKVGTKIIAKTYFRIQRKCIIRRQMLSYTCFGHKISSFYCFKRPQKIKSNVQKTSTKFQKSPLPQKTSRSAWQKVDPWEHEGSNHCMRLREILNTLKEDIMNFRCARFVRMESKHLAKLLMKKKELFAVLLYFLLILPGLTFKEQ